MDSERIFFSTPATFNNNFFFEQMRNFESLTESFNINSMNMTTLLDALSEIVDYNFKHRPKVVEKDWIKNGF